MFFNSDTIAVKQQAAFGTAVAPDTIVPFTSGEWEHVQELIGSEVVTADRAQSAKRLGYNHYKIKITAHFSAKNHDVFLKSYFGKYAFTADDPEAVANKHSHQLADSSTEFDNMLKRGFTLEGGGEGVFYTFIDCAVDSIKITTPKPGIMMIDYEIIATKMTESSSTAATGSAIPGLVLFDNFELVLSAGTLASEVVQSIHGFEFDGKRGLVPENDMTTRTPLSFGKADLCTNDFNFTINQDAAGRAAINTDYLNAAVKSLIVTFTSTQTIAGAATAKYVSKFIIPDFNYISKTPVVDNGIRRETYNCSVGVNTTTTPIEVLSYNEQLTFA